MPSIETATAAINAAIAAVDESAASAVHAELCARAVRAQRDLVALSLIVGPPDTRSEREPARRGY